MCSKGAVTRTKVDRMSRVGVAVGYLLFALPALWAILLIAYFLKPAPAANLNQLERMAEDFSRGLVEGFLCFFGIVGAVAALLGWLLVSKKEVLKCSHCGVEVPPSVIGDYDAV